MGVGVALGDTVAVSDAWVVGVTVGDGVVVGVDVWLAVMVGLGVGVSVQNSAVDV